MPTFDQEYVINDSVLDVTCLCHGEKIAFECPRLVIRFAELHDPASKEVIVEIQTPASAIHHGNPYAVKIRGVSTDMVFAFPCLSVYEIYSIGSSDWILTFRSSPDKNGNHFAARDKTGTVSRI